MIASNIAFLYGIYVKNLNSNDGRSGPPIRVKSKERGGYLSPAVRILPL